MEANLFRTCCSPRRTRFDRVLECEVRHFWRGLRSACREELEPYLVPRRAELGDKSDDVTLIGRDEFTTNDRRLGSDLGIKGAVVLI